MTQKILVDWGGTIIRDDYLFKAIAEKSNNHKDVFISPDSWKKIKYIGNENYFKEIKNKFFNIGECYPNSEEVISSFFGKSVDSKTRIYINFDNNPNLEFLTEQSLKNITESIYNRNIDVNGVFINSDKIKLCKNNQIDIVVDDDPRIAISMALAGIKCVLMLKKWNKAFDIDMLQITMKEEKFKIIKENIYIAEDWFDAGYILCNIVDGKIV